MTRNGFFCGFVMSLLMGCTTPVIMAPPSAALVGQWAGFSKDCPLKAELSFDRESSDMGRLKWSGSYRNQEKSLESFNIAIFEPGSLWKERRAEMVKGIEEMQQKTNEMPEEFKKLCYVEQRSDGRKVYFTILGFGPGGSAIGAFTFSKDYDLLVIQDTDSEHGLPPEKRMKKPISSNQDLSLFFSKVEEYLGLCPSSVCQIQKSKIIDK